MSTQYDDIIHLPHHVSKTRPQMSMLDRAAQFSPFAALTGYEDAIQETGRLTDERMELSDEDRELLDRKWHYLQEIISDRPEITVTYFVPDEKKAGGSYLTLSGAVRKMDEFERILILTDGRKIRLDDIADMEGEVFAPFIRQEEN